MLCLKLIPLALQFLQLAQVLHPVRLEQLLLLLEHALVSPKLQPLASNFVVLIFNFNLLDLNLSHESLFFLNFEFFLLILEPSPCIQDFGLFCGSVQIILLHFVALLLNLRLQHVLLLGKCGILRLQRPLLCLQLHIIVEHSLLPRPSQVSELLMLLLLLPQYIVFPLIELALLFCYLPLF